MEQGENNQQSPIIIIVIPTFSVFINLTYKWRLMLPALHACSEVLTFKWHISFHEAPNRQAVKRWRLRCHGDVQRMRVEEEGIIEVGWHHGWLASQGNIFERD